MAPPLVLRLIADATGYFKTAEEVVSTNTKIGRSALATGADFEKAAKMQVAAGVKAIEVQRAMVAELTKAKAAAASPTERAAATTALTRAQNNLNRSMGVTTVGTRAASKEAQVAERDLSKLTRGALAGSGAFSAMGRSLAFASGGFLVFSGAAEFISGAITGAEDLEKANRSLDVAIRHTGGDVKALRPEYEETAKAAAQFGISQADATTGLARATVLTGNAAAAQRAYQEALVISKATGKDFNAVLIATSKGQEGVTTSLQRYGILIAKGTPGQEQFNMVMARFGGQAAANTTASDKLRASLANTEAIVGKDLLPTFNHYVDSLSNWLQKMTESGRLQRDVNGVLAVGVDTFKILGGVIGRVDDATGSFENTLKIILALKVGSMLTGWISSLEILAAKWGLVGAAATRAGAAETAALAEGGAAGAAGGAGSAAGGLLTGGAIGALIARMRFGGGGINPVIGEYTGAGALEAGGAVGMSATGIGALAVAAVLATEALTQLAQTTGDKLGAGSTYDKSLSAVEGFLTGGLAGNSQFSPLHAIFGSILHGRPPFEQALQNTFGGPPPPRYVPTGQLLQQLGLPTLSQILHGPGSSASMFGGAEPMKQFWTQFTLTFHEQLTQAEAALTKGSADDVAAAKQEIARIKRLIDEGRLHGNALLQALGLEAQALNTIWSAESAAAQKRAQAAAQAKARIEAQIQNSIDPIALEVRLSEAEAKGQPLVPWLKKLRAAAEAAIASGKLTLQQQKQAWDQIASLNQQIKDAIQQGQQEFEEPMKLQIALAREQALGLSTTKTLLAMKKAAEKAIASGKYSGQALIALYNEIADINSQLQSSVTNAYGDYKKASLKAETAGLGLTAAQRRALEARLSQRGPGGTTPSTGTGAGGYIIDPDTGRPVKVKGPGKSNRMPSTGSGGGRIYIDQTIKLSVNIAGKHVTTVVTKGQQSYRGKNPSSRRGPHAGAPTS